MATSAELQISAKSRWQAVQYIVPTSYSTFLPNGRNEGGDCHHQTLRSVKIISRGQCWVSGDIRPAWAARQTPCHAFSFVAPITIAMPSMKREWALGRSGRSGRILQSGAEHVCQLPRALVDARGWRNNNVLTECS